MDRIADDERRADIRRLWTAGDYAQVGAMFEPVSRELVRQLEVRGRDLVDAATGTGNTALVAAAAGARVAAFDLTPRLVEIARQRAVVAGASIDWRIGDLLAAPFPDASADVVTSTFGAFTADDPPRCAAELVRLCRPGGTIALTAWHRDGAFGRLPRVLRTCHPALVDPDAPDPRVWADRDGLEDIFTGLPVTIEVETHDLPVCFPSIEAAMDLFELISGPVMAMRSAVEQSGGDWAATRAAAIASWEPISAPASGGIEVAATYTLALLRRT